MMRHTGEDKLRLPMVDESMASLEAMRKRYERPRASTNQNPKPKTKGKDRMGQLEEDVPRLRQHWYERYQEILQGTREQLLPLREVNHEINLVDPAMRYKYHLPRCPTALREDFHKKLNRYIDTGWWEPRTATQAAPLMCIPKKDGRLRTVIDARQRNDNTVKDVTPLPDQKVI